MNEWHVITAGPSAGKSSTLRELSGRGYRTVPEAARLHIDQKVSEGLDPKEVREQGDFQEQVEDRDFWLRSRVPPTGNETIFFDRSLADNIAYRRHYGKEIPVSLIEKCWGVYDTVFLLDRLEFEDDYARSEDRKEAAQLHDEIRTAYRLLGHEPIEVPLIPVDERADFIVDHIGQ